jgi:hypothetical protein
VKNILRILLFVFLLSPFLTSYFWFFHSRAEIRNEIRKMIFRGIDRKDLVLMSFSQEDAETRLHWEKPWEFGFNGQMYDVVETIAGNDSIHYWCIWDKKETALNKRIKELIAKSFGHHPQNQENQKQIKLLFQILYLKDHFRWSPDFPFIQQSKFPDYSADWTAALFPPPVPPPRAG